MFAYAPNPTGWIDPLGLIDASTAHSRYANSDIDFSSIAKALTAFHFEHRDELNGMHPTYTEVTAQGSGWRLLPVSQALFQDDGHGAPELKFVYPDGREAVFNGDCLCPEIRPQYKATYNCVNPGVVPQNWYNLPGWHECVYRMLGHGVIDVAPYFAGGNIRGYEPDRFVPPPEHRTLEFVDRSIRGLYGLPTFP